MLHVLTYRKPAQIAGIHKVKFFFLTCNTTSNIFKGQILFLVNHLNQRALEHNQTAVIVLKYSKLSNASAPQVRWQQCIIKSRVRQVLLRATAFDNIQKMFRNALRPKALETNITQSPTTLKATSPVTLPKVYADKNHCEVMQQNVLQNFCQSKLTQEEKKFYT